jgi:hypothetical protein
MRVRLGIVFGLSSLFLVSCGSDAPHRDLDHNATASNTVSQSDLPRLMIARVADHEADQENAVVEIRTIEGDVSIASYEDAARAFARGRALDVGETVSASLSGNKSARVDLGAPVQSPIQSPVQAPITQKSQPCADPCKPQVSGGKTNGGFIRAERGGLFSGLGLFGRLQPTVRCGCGDVGYDKAGIYSSKDYRYSVYQQAPGKGQNNPSQVALPPPPANGPQGPQPGRGPQTGYGPAPIGYYPGGGNQGSTPGNQGPNSGTAGGR